MDKYTGKTLISNGSNGNRVYKIVRKSDNQVIFHLIINP